MLTFQQEEMAYWAWCTQPIRDKASCLPCPGLSDHITMMLRPTYRPTARVIRHAQNQTRVWSEGPSYALKDCFSTTDWQLQICSHLQ